MTKLLTGEEVNYKAITYYAFAKDSQGLLRQIKVIRIHPAGMMPFKSQGFTDKTYKTIKEANADMELLNCK